VGQSGSTIVKTGSYSAPFTVNLTEDPIGIVIPGSITWKYPTPILNFTCNLAPGEYFINSTFFIGPVNNGVYSGWYTESFGPPNRGNTTVTRFEVIEIPPCFSMLSNQDGQPFYWHLEATAFNRTNLLTTCTFNSFVINTKITNSSNPNVTMTYMFPSNPFANITNHYFWMNLKPKFPKFFF